MRVAICRLFNDGTHAKRPKVVLLKATNLDTAEEWFNNNDRKKFPEWWNWCYIDLDYKGGRNLTRKGVK